MSKLIAFVAAYAALIISVISLISNLLSGNTTDSGNSQSPRKPLRIVVSAITIVLAIAVLVACYISFEPDPDKSDETIPIIAESTTPELKEVETVPKKIIPMTTKGSCLPNMGMSPVWVMRPSTIVIPIPMTA